MWSCRTGASTWRPTDTRFSPAQNENHFISSSSLTLSQRKRPPSPQPNQGLRTHPALHTRSPLTLCESPHHHFLSTCWFCILTAQKVSLSPKQIFLHLFFFPPLLKCSQPMAIESFRKYKSNSIFLA